MQISSLSGLLIAAELSANQNMANSNIRFGIFETWNTFGGSITDIYIMKVGVVELSFHLDSLYNLLSIVLSTFVSVKIKIECILSLCIRERLWTIFSIRRKINLKVIYYLFKFRVLNLS